MKTNEKQALLQYLEFQLLTLVEGTEKHIDDPDIIGDMYDKAYAILVDIEMSIDTNEMLVKKVQNSK